MLRIMLKFNEVSSFCFSARTIYTTLRFNGLVDFFDSPENWTKGSIGTGRPWRKDELRIKSNEDLHKLWYVLLKERNMIMTMQAEYDRRYLKLPNGERLEKLEESMENLLLVVEERDRAFEELEYGEIDGPDEHCKIDILGREVLTDKEEHLMPKSSNEDTEFFSSHTTDLLRKLREKEILKKKDHEFWKKYNEETIRYDEQFVKKLK